MKFLILFLLSCRSVFVQNFCVDSFYKRVNQIFKIPELNFFIYKTEAGFSIKAFAKANLSIISEKYKKKEILKNIRIENVSNIILRVSKHIHNIIIKNY